MQSASDDKKYEEKSYSDCSGSEYLPEESMSEDYRTPQLKNKPDGTSEKLGDSLASPFKMQSANATEPCNSTVDGGEPTLWVKKINKAEKRKWDKKHYCVYCSKPQSKIARHLQRRHTQEVEVSRAISFPKGSKKRKILFEKLRNKGDYHHNVEVLQKRDGEIITWRQPTRDVSPSEYLPCRYCLALFVKHDLWKHQKSCKIKPDMKSSKRNRVQAAAFCLVLTKDHASEGSRQIMDKMRIDSISSESKSDPLICKYAEILYEKHKETELGYCAQKTRELGRFMLTVKSIDSSVKTLREVCVPTRFRLAVSAACKTSGHFQPKRSFHTLSLACKLGYSLKRVAEILVGESVQKDDFVSERDAADFIKLIDTYWTAYVSRRARTDPKQNKWNKDDPIPLTEDVVLLQEQPKALEEKSKQQLSGATAWKEGRSRLDSTSENNGKDTVCISVPDNERSSPSPSPNFDWDADDNEIDTERDVGTADVKRPPRKRPRTWRINCTIENKDKGAVTYQKMPWRPEENDAVRRRLKECSILRRVPGKTEDWLREEPSLHSQFHSKHKGKKDNKTSEEESCSEYSESEYLPEESTHGDSGASPATAEKPASTSKTPEESPSDDSCASPFKNNVAPASKKPTTAAGKPVSASKKPASASKKSVNHSKKPASASKKSVNPSKKPASASKKSVSALEKPEGSLSADASPFKMQSASDDKTYEEKSYSDCSGSEYLPEESMSEDYRTPQLKNKPDSASEKLDDSCASPFKMQSANATEPCNSTVDGGEPTLWVKKTDKAEKRKWDKKHYCVYCWKPQSKIARHLQMRHTKEVEVSHAISFPKGSKKRKILLEQLRNKGDYQHNIEVLQKKDGEIITWRRPVRDVSPSEYLPCRYCLALFVKRDLWKHQKSCKIKPEANSSKPEANSSKRDRVQAVSFCLIPTKNHASEGSRHIMDKMRIDSISSESKSDPLICKYAEIMYETHKETELGYCTQKTRELGRFMLTVKSIDSSVKTLRDVCVPARFRLAVSAARKASGHTQQKRSYHPLSLACKLGYSLKRVAEILVGESVQKDDFVSERDAADFIKLIDTYWTAYVSRRARRDPKQNKWNKDDPIPLTEDVVLLQEHPKALEEKSKQQLSGATAWKEGRSRLDSTSENNGKDTVCTSVPDNERSSRSSSPNFDWDADDNEIDTERGVGRADVKRPPRT